MQTNVLVIWKRKCYYLYNVYEGIDLKFNRWGVEKMTKEELTDLKNSILEDEEKLLLKLKSENLEQD